MNKIRITHYYTNLPPIFGIETELSVDEISKALYYLTTLHSQMPSLDCNEDTLSEDTAVRILDKLYSEKFNLHSIKLDQDQAFNWDAVLDLYEIESDHHTYRTNEIFEEINAKFATSDVELALLQDASEEIAKIQSDFDEINDVSSSDSYHRDIARLKMILTGAPIPESWEVINLQRKDLTGSSYEPSEQAQTITLT
ncbi:TPA: hypothetical protein MW242_003093 [Acinetobacter baumannii]|nr:hypothetical protein [Acinetobacter baumannii]